MNNYTETVSLAKSFKALTEAEGSIDVITCLGGKNETLQTALAAYDNNPTNAILGLMTTLHNTLLVVENLKTGFDKSAMNFDSLLEMTREAQAMANTAIDHANMLNDLLEGNEDNG